MHSPQTDISPDQVFVKRTVSTQTDLHELYHEAELIVKNYKKINQYWHFVQIRSYAICAFSLGLVVATLIQRANK